MPRETFGPSACDVNAGCINGAGLSGFRRPAMLAALRPGERRALLTHEHVYLEHRHDRFLVVAMLATDVLALPFAAKSVRYCLRRWSGDVVV